MAEINKEYERGFKDGLKSKIGDELLPMIEQILVGVSDSVKSVIPLMVDRMEIKANLDSNDWISCSERMPEDNKSVLCYVSDTTGEGRGYVIGSCEHSEFWFLKIGDNKQFSFPYMQIKVTHWMPLPEPPKE